MDRKKERQIQKYQRSFYEKIIQYDMRFAKLYISMNYG